MSGKYALIIANTEYTDPRLTRLTAPGKDAEAFARLLKAPDLAAFNEVATLVNRSSYDARRAIARFFIDRAPEDLLLLYFSGHGVRDEQGRLFLATKDTDNSILDATAIPSDFVTREMDECRSKRQVLILDCCNSGAFAYGTKAATAASMGTASAFEGKGYGRVVLTATDSTQYAYEGDQVIGQQTANSLFTHFLIVGLEGEADTDGDGVITVDELYDYASEQVRRATPKQKPEKFAYHQQEQIILTSQIKRQTIRPIPLNDPDLEGDLQSTRPYTREGAVWELARILNGSNMGKAMSAEQRLKEVIEKDDSRSVTRLAENILADYYASKGAPASRAERPRATKPRTAKPAPATAPSEPARDEQKPAAPAAPKPALETPRLPEEPEGVRAERTTRPAVVQMPLRLRKLPQWLRVTIGSVVVLGLVGLAILLSVRGAGQPSVPVATSAQAPTVAAPQASATPKSSITLEPSATPIPTKLPNGTKLNYIVQSGDTLWAIAAKFGSTVADILNANNLVEASGIYPGQTLVIPANIVTAEPRSTATVGPMPAAMAYVVFNEPFLDNANGWFTDSFSSGRATGSKAITEGAYTWNVTARQSILTLEMDPKGRQLADFSAATEAQAISGAASKDFGLILRRQETYSFYYFAVNDSARSFAFFRIDKGNRYTLVSWTNAAAIKPGQPNRLLVTGVGPEFSFFINDQYVGRSMDSLYKTGTFGLAAELYNLGDTGTFVFNDFELRSPTAE